MEQAVRLSDPRPQPSDTESPRGELKRRTVRRGKAEATISADQLPRSLSWLANCDLYALFSIVAYTRMIPAAAQPFPFRHSRQQCTQRRHCIFDKYTCRPEARVTHGTQDDMRPEAVRPSEVLPVQSNLVVRHLDERLVHRHDAIVGQELTRAIWSAFLLITFAISEGALAGPCLKPSRVSSEKRKGMACDDGQTKSDHSWTWSFRCERAPSDVFGTWVRR